MARLESLLAIALLAGPLLAQRDDQFRKAGVCGRCHVISVVEWGMSKHSRISTDCVACHGASQGHVVDERNNIKPEHVPHGNAVAGMCATCHGEGCPKTKQKAGCDSCHHVHALVDPNKPPAVKDEALDKRTVQFGSYQSRMEEGERLVKAGNWAKARVAFGAALKVLPGDGDAAARLRACERRLAPAPAGFEVIGDAFDASTGLPREVRVAGLGISMVLIPGGSVDLGSERLPNAVPIHSATVSPFYLARFETTQAEWQSLMGSNPSLHKGDKLPVEQVSWEDAQALIRKLNEKVPGGGFRLPTESEWEYAARAGTRNVALGERAWFGQETNAEPHPVGSKQPNRLGLFDLEGNVWEWTSSCARPYPYSANDGREAADAPGMRILRGGGYADPEELLDPAMRHAERTNRKFPWNGIRLARSIPE